MTIASIITCYGLPELTDALIKDLVRDNDKTDIFVVDNMGNYVIPQLPEHDNIRIHVYQSSENLRWTKGMNTGISFARNFGDYEAYILFNNDVRLSPHFINNMREAHLNMPNLGLLAPSYDDVYEQQKGIFRGSAHKYKPVMEERIVNLVDGTLFYIPREAMQVVGVLDEEIFGFTGWGGDLDYCHRVKQAGFDIAVTFRAYINHFHQGTVKTLYPDYNSVAGKDMEESMNKKYGPPWRDIIYRPLG